MSELPVLHSAEAIRARIAELGAAITADIPADEPLVCIGVLKGAFLFMADLVRVIDRPMTCDFIRVSSYEGTRSSGVVRFELDTTQSVHDKHVVLIEDIIDTGLTIHYLVDALSARKPRSLRIASFLHKKARTKEPIEIDYLGFEIDDLFVVGYGLDYEGQYRNLPYLSYLSEDQI